MILKEKPKKNLADKRLRSIIKYFRHDCEGDDLQHD